jgi:hypothetical protein
VLYLHVEPLYTQTHFVSFNQRLATRILLPCTFLILSIPRTKMDKQASHVTSHLSALTH